MPPPFGIRPGFQGCTLLCGLTAYDQPLKSILLLVLADASMVLLSRHLARQRNGFCHALSVSHKRVHRMVPLTRTISPMPIKQYGTAASLTSEASSSRQFTADFTAACNIRTYSDEEFRAAFRAFDKSGDGKIDVAEVAGLIRRVTKSYGGISEAEEAQFVEAFMKRCDANQDGHVTWPEFHAALRVSAGARIRVQGRNRLGQTTAERAMDVSVCRAIAHQWSVGACARQT